jgi:hypothetical protein
LNEAAETSEVKDPLRARREFYKEPDMAWIVQPRPRNIPVSFRTKLLSSRRPFREKTYRDRHERS